jgi:hypothetical protein
MLHGNNDGNPGTMAIILSRNSNSAENAHLHATTSVVVSNNKTKKFAFIIKQSKASKASCIRLYSEVYIGLECRK